MNDYDIDDDPREDDIEAECEANLAMERWQRASLPPVLGPSPLLIQIPVHTECLLSLMVAYVAWITVTGRPWTRETFAITDSLIAQAYTHGRLSRDPAQGESHVDEK